MWKRATGFARTEQTTGPPDLPSFPYYWLIPAMQGSYKAVHYTLWDRRKLFYDANHNTIVIKVKQDA